MIEHLVQAITEESIKEIRSWGPRAAAEFYDERVRDLEEREKRTYVEYGLILIEVERGELHKLILDPICRVCNVMVAWENGVCPRCGYVQECFTSMDRWLITAAPVSRTTGYMAKRAVESGLSAGLSIERMSRIHRTNLDVVAKLSPPVRINPDVLEAAETKSHDELLQKIEAEFPAEHMESKRGLNLKPTKTARAIIDDAIRAAEVLHELEGRESAIEFICGSWLSSNCDLEEFQGMNNLQAYLEKRKETK